MVNFKGAWIVMLFLLLPAAVMAQSSRQYTLTSFYPSANGNFNSLTTNALQITGAGSIGIGTTAVTGWWNDLNNIAARIPSATGNFDVQGPNGTATYLRVNSTGITASRPVTINGELNVAASFDAPAAVNVTNSGVVINPNSPCPMGPCLPRKNSLTLFDNVVISPPAGVSYTADSNIYFVNTSGNTAGILGAWSTASSSALRISRSSSTHTWIDGPVSIGTSANVPTSTLAVIGGVETEGPNYFKSSASIFGRSRGSNVAPWLGYGNVSISDSSIAIKSGDGCETPIANITFSQANNLPAAGDAFIGYVNSSGGGLNLNAGGARVFLHQNNVGINTVAPLATLDVIGGAAATALRVKSGDASNLTALSVTGAASAASTGSTALNVVAGGAADATALQVTGKARVSSGDVYVSDGNCSNDGKGCVHIGNTQINITEDAVSGTAARISFGERNNASPAMFQAPFISRSGSGLLLQNGNSTATQLYVNTNVGINQSAPAATLDVNGTIRVGSVAGVACNASRAGIMKYDYANNRLQVCNGSAWKNVTFDP
jgi:hypothetical protein